MSARHAYHVRWADKDDIPEIRSIDARSFEANQAWTAEEFQVLREKTVIAMVAEDPHGVVVGFMVYRIHTHHLDLLRFAVTPARRRCGVGTAMIEKLQGKLSPVRNRIYIDVPERCLIFQCFLKACKIPAVCVDRGKDGGDDTFNFMHRFVPEEQEVMA